MAQISHHTYIQYNSYSLAEPRNFFNENASCISGWNRVSVTMWYHRAGASKTIGGGGVLYETYLSQNIMFIFLHDYLLLDVTVEYITDTCRYVTAYRIPGGPKKDTSHTGSLVIDIYTHFHVSAKGSRRNHPLRSFHKPISLFRAVGFELTNSGWYLGRKSVPRTPVKSTAP